MKGIQPKHADKLAGLLDRLHQAREIRDMQFPGSGLHRLEPRQEGRWAVKVSGNWRLTFRYRQGEAFDVNYEDSH